MKLTAPVTLKFQTDSEGHRTTIKSCPTENELRRVLVEAHLKGWSLLGPTFSLVPEGAPKEQRLEPTKRA